MDALVFAGGIGEKSAELRRSVVEQAACLGFGIDDDDDAGAGAEEDAVVRDVSSRKQGVRHKVLVCRTDEQLQMAKTCAHDDALWPS